MNFIIMTAFRLRFSCEMFARIKLPGVCCLSCLVLLLITFFSSRFIPALSRFENTKWIMLDDAVYFLNDGENLNLRK